MKKLQTPHQRTARKPRAINSKAQAPNPESAIVDPKPKPPNSNRALSCKPKTLGQKPKTLFLAFQTQNPKPKTLHPKPYTLSIPNPYFLNSKPNP